MADCYFEQFLPAPPVILLVICLILKFKRGIKLMKKRIPLAEAKELLKSNISRFPASDVHLDQASGRALAENIKAPMNQPPFDRSPLDGFALRAADTRGAEKKPVKLDIVDWLYAGDEPQQEINPGQATRIMTGAPIPSGADCVIRQEEASWSQEEVEIKKELKPGQNFAPAGEDIKKGEMLCQEGLLLRSPQLAVLASMGIEKVSVRPFPRVTVITTGNELQPVGEKLRPGKIYNSNNYMISARLEETGADVRESLTVGDKKDEIKDTITRTLPESDFLVTTGGVSVGEKDLMIDVIKELGGEIYFWKLDLKPGTPIVCGEIEGKTIFALSGNPAAALITYDLLVRHIITHINGLKHLDLTETKAVFADEFARPSSTRRLLRSWLVESESGNIVKLSRGKQRPGVLKSTLECNCLVDIPAGSPPLSEGKEVRVLRLPEIYHH